MKKENDHHQTFLVELELNEDDEFKTAQNISIYPQNSPEQVNNALKYFQIDDPFQMIVFEVESDKIKVPFPSRTSI